VRTHVYRAPKAACRSCDLLDQCGPKKKGAGWRRSVTRSEDPAATTAFKAKMETREAALGERWRDQDGTTTIMNVPEAAPETVFSLRELRPYERQQVRYRGRLSRLLPVSCLSFARRLLR
jgi:hypothetical protein